MNPMNKQAAYLEAYEQRRQTILASIRESERHSIWSLNALLEAEAEPDPALIHQAVQRAVPERNGIPVGGPFEILPSMALLSRWERRLPAESVEHIANFYLNGIQERGNTENHWLMFYTGNFLAAERWCHAGELWNGMPPAAMQAEAKRWLLGMIDRSVRCGHHEYDSTWYQIEHVTPWILLADMAGDAEVRNRAADMLTLLVLDMACEYFHGIWAGGHSREGYRMNTWTRLGPIMGVQYLFFGGEEFNPEYHRHPWITIAAVSSYRPPALLADLAWDYDTPAVIRKTKAPRNIIRHVLSPPHPVRKYTYRSCSFALGSTQTGLPGAPAGPIDLTSWDLSWLAPSHEGKIVCNHPYLDPGRFSAFLPDLPHIARRTIGGGKPFLQSPDRLFGASPYERMLQHEGTIIVLYRIPPDDEAPFVNLFLPKTLAWESRQGWLLADAGDFSVGLSVLGTYHWNEIREARDAMFMVTNGDLVNGWLLRICGPAAGVVLEAVEHADSGGFERYCASRIVSPPDLEGWPGDGRVALRSHGGHELEIFYDGPHNVDGKPVRYEDYPLFDGPGITAAMGSGRICVQRDGESVELDFGVDSRKPLLPMRVIC